MKKLFIILGLVFSVNGFAGQVMTEDCGRIDQSFRDSGKQVITENVATETSTTQEESGKQRN